MVFTDRLKLFRITILSVVLVICIAVLSSNTVYAKPLAVADLDRLFGHANAMLTNSVSAGAADDTVMVLVRFSNESSALIGVKVDEPSTIEPPQGATRSDQEHVYEGLLHHQLRLTPGAKIPPG
jgi:hypothetical protein